VDPVTAPSAALIVAVPVPVPVASPVLLIEAIAGADDDQLTLLVRS
jgi:hypothetical protein